VPLLELILRHRETDGTAALVVDGIKEPGKEALALAIAADFKLAPDIVGGTSSTVPVCCRLLSNC
jgi:hypothetical protein